MKHKKNNSLLLVAGVLICQYFILNLLFPDISEEYINQRNNSQIIDSDLSLWIDGLLFPIIILPIIEELGNRGFLAKNKITKIVGFTIFCLLTFLLSAPNLILKSIFIITGIFIYFVPYKFLKTKHSLLFRVSISSIVFSFGHTATFNTAILPFLITSGYYLGFGFFFCWYVINYSLKKAILLHIAFNALVILAVQDFPYKEGQLQQKKYLQDKVNVSWKTRSFFNNDDSTLMFLENGYEMKNIFPYKTTMNIINNQDSLENYVPVKENTRYDIKITSDTVITDSLYLSIMKDINVLERIK
ncbi:CPBP family intramembrane glutamic endopeptidase [Mesonia aquimarina]|uniref:CPBP family intramembrane glutamic endopeptidase n=1 Tax=Mesonia aquimarina TaxID=1504967 RepID=UPI000EF627C7|nr:CPBP family intramembrane glutamic endopeptidase [Mesonia aquimarina]